MENRNRISENPLPCTIPGAKTRSGGREGASSGRDRQTADEIQPVVTPVPASKRGRIVVRRASLSSPVSPGGASSGRDTEPADGIEPNLAQTSSYASVVLR